MYSILVVSGFTERWEASRHGSHGVGAGTAGAGGTGERRSRAGAGSGRDAALATRVPPCVGFFAFFISLSSVNSLHPTTKRGPPLSVPHDYSLKHRAGPSLPSDGLGDTNRSHRRESGGPAPSSNLSRFHPRKLPVAALGWKPIRPAPFASRARWLPFHPPGDAAALRAPYLRDTELSLSGWIDRDRWGRYG